MTTVTPRSKAGTRRPKSKQASTGASSVSKPQTTAAELRARLALTQAKFARMLSVSIRSLATLESGNPPTEPVARRLSELDRLTTALSDVIKKESLGKWLESPTPAFGGLRPLEVIERDESDRIWEMIYFLRSGAPA